MRPTSRPRPDPLLPATLAALLLAACARLSATDPDAASAAAPAPFSLPDAPLAARFADPPAGARILKIIHSWPDEPAAQDALRELLLRQGFGGVVCNVGFDDYLESDGKWQAFARAVSEAHRAGMALWLYDERGYPSGNAGGLVLRDHPEWEARGLLVADAECGPGPVTLEAPPGRIVLARAFPRTPEAVAAAAGQASAPEDGVELGSRVRDGRLEWDAPAGRWDVLLIAEDRLYEGTHAEGNLWRKMPYINLLQREPTARFLELTHGRYAERLGPDLGRLFDATFTDEPSLMSLFLRRMPYRPLPWAPELPAEFARRRGYALEPILPHLAADLGPDTPRYRHDFWLTVGELVAENFFGQIQTWCQAHRVPSGGHLLAEENITDHVPLYGDILRCLRQLGAPSMDCLTSVPSDVPWHVARLVASAAELEGRPLVMCETSDHAQVWRGPGDTRPKRAVTEAEIRGTCNRLMAGGVNVITSYYSFRDLPDDALRRLNAWVGRCATMLRGGRQVADIALLYPAESLWTAFVPARHWAGAAPAATRIAELYRTALDRCYAARRDVTIIDSRTLAEGRVDRGGLHHGDLCWRVVVLPGVDTLPLAAWENLARVAESGGIVIALGARPRNGEREFPSARVTEIAQTLFGSPNGEPAARAVPGGGTAVFLPHGYELLLPRILDSVLEPDIELYAADGSGADPIRITHRRVAERDVWFLINDGDRPWRGAARVRGLGPGERWDPESGTVTAVDAEAACALELAAYGALFLRFAEAAPAPLHPERAVADLGRLSARALPLGEPGVGRGEFVREEFGRDPARDAPGHRVWRAAARLLKSDVDTFLFVSFPAPPGLALDRDGAFALETWVPAGQRTPSNLLVIVQEEGGGDFVAATSRALGAEGAERCLVPLDRFRLAGWAQDANGQLDLDRIAQVRVGWGGYLGTEGETVEFSVAGPAFLAVPRETEPATSGAAARALRWAEERLAGPPFSFVYGGRDSRGFLGEWEREVAETAVSETRRRRTMTWTDPQTSLEVRAVCDLYLDTPGVDWTVHFTNRGVGDAPILEQVRALDISVPLESGVTSVFHSLRSTSGVDDWLPFSEPVAPGQSIAFAPVRGRSSCGACPFFNVSWGAAGVVTAIGWTGQWHAAVERDGSGLHMQAGMQNLRLSLHPGETIRTPRILQLYWQEPDPQAPYNLFRRTMFAHIMPRAGGVCPAPPIAHLSTAFYETDDGTEADVLAHLEAAKGLGFECFWLDAYYGPTRFPTVGNYVLPLERAVDPRRFPRGLKPIGEAAHAAGMQFLLWVEPERICPGTLMAKEHPDWVVLPPDGGWGMLNLGMPEARQYLTDYLHLAIKEYGIDCLRIDNAVDFGRMWRILDGAAADRVGMAEIRYVEGLYRVWDELLAANPSLFIDNVSSGGHRIDLETASRAINLWRTDATIQPLLDGAFEQAALQNQVMTAGLSRFVPFTVSGQSGAAPYLFRSGFNAGISFCEDVRPEGYPRELLRQAIAEGKRIRKYFPGDLYALCDITTRPEDWCVLQYHRPEQADGMVLAFRRPAAPEAGFALGALRGIEAAAEYEVTESRSYAPEPPLQMRGAALLEHSARIAEQPGSLLLEYRRLPSSLP